LFVAFYRRENISYLKLEREKKNNHVGGSFTVMIQGGSKRKKKLIKSEKHIFEKF